MIKCLRGLLLGRRTTETVLYGIVLQVLPQRVEPSYELAASEPIGAAPLQGLVPMLQGNEDCHHVESAIMAGMLAQKHLRSNVSLKVTGSASSVTLKWSDTMAPFLQISSINYSN